MSVLIWLFWDDIKKLFSKSDPYIAPENSKGSGAGKDAGEDKKNPPADTAPKIIPIKKGDSVIASKDDAKAYNEDMSKVVKTYKKNNYVGTVIAVNLPSQGWITFQTKDLETRVIMKTGVKRQY